jgi:hypothetical protein
MTDKTVGRILSLWLVLVGLSFLASCGAEPPWFAPLEPGNIIVNSTPPGASIFLNGVNQNSTTPDTLEGLDPGVYHVTVELEDFVSDPDDVKVVLTSAATDSATFTLSQTGFSIESPVGARILVNNVDTGKIVPASVAGLEAGQVQVSLELDGYLIRPAEYEVTIVDKEITEIPAGIFTLRAKKTVILEGFSNVSCPPCPQLTDNLVAMAAKPEFSSDKVQFIEFAVSWPALNDPFYLANPGENTERHTMYNVFGAPDLYIDGVRQDDPLDATAMEDAIRVAIDSDPGFVVDLSTVFSSSTVDVTVTLTASQVVDLTDHVLFVAIYEKEIEILPAPGTNGQTEFHHVFRDRVDTLPTLSTLDPGSPQDYEMTLTSGTAGPDSYVVLAFVQHDTNHAILQAGSTATAKSVDSVGSSDEPAPVRSPERKLR